MPEELTITDEEHIAGTPPGTWAEESFDPERIHGLVKGLIPSEEVRQGRNFGVHVVDGQDQASDIGRFVESTVFSKYFNNDLETMKKEYGPYDENSTFLLVLDYEKEQPVGVIRIIRPSEKGLKSIVDVVAPESPWYRPGDTYEDRMTEIGDEPDHTVDISTMAVMPDYKSSHAQNGASASLYSTCVRWSLANDYNHWVSIVDKRIYTMMQSWGEPFTPFQGADWAPYLDSPKSLPVSTELHSGLERVRQFDEEMSKQQGQQFNIAGLYTRGDGLHEDFVLPEF